MECLSPLSAWGTPSQFVHRFACLSTYYIPACLSLPQLTYVFCYPLYLIVHLILTTCLLTYLQPFICIHMFLFTCLFTCIQLPIFLSTSLPIFLSTSFLPSCRSMYMSIYLPIRLYSSICQSFRCYQLIYLIAHVYTKMLKCLWQQHNIKAPCNFFI